SAGRDLTRRAGAARQGMVAVDLLLASDRPPHPGLQRAAGVVGSRRGPRGCVVRNGGALLLNGDPLESGFILVVSARPWYPLPVPLGANSAAWAGLGELRRDFISFAPSGPHLARPRSSRATASGRCSATSTRRSASCSWLRISTATPPQTGTPWA